MITVSLRFILEHEIYAALLRLKIYIRYFSFDRRVVIWKLIKVYELKRVRKISIIDTQCTSN